MPFQIVIDVDQEFRDVVPPITTKEEVEEDMAQGMAVTLAGTTAEDISVYIDTDPGLDGDDA